MIGLFNECFPPIMDGVSLTVSNLAQQFYELGEDVMVGTPQVPGLDAGQYPYKVAQYYSFPIPGRPPYRCGLPYMDLKFQRDMSHQEFSILHAHAPFSSGEYAMKMAHRQGVPLVATFHSKFRDDFKRVIPNRHFVDMMTKRVVDFFEAADEVWVPQPSVGETLREYGYHGHYEVVDNGTDMAGQPYSEEMKLQAKRGLYVDEDQPLLLFVGQHIWEKGVETVIRALAKIKDMPFHAIFVGDGYAKNEMQQMAHKLGLSGNADYRKDRLTFFGTVCDRDMLQQFYTAADLFLFPSMYDNAPLVVREAASRFTPSIVARGSNTAELFHDGLNGFIADATVDAFANCLRYLLERPCLIDVAGRGAAQSLARPWRDIAIEVLDRYKHAIARKKNRKVI